MSHEMATNQKRVFLKKTDSRSLQTFYIFSRCTLFSPLFSFCLLFIHCAPLLAWIKQSNEGLLQWVLFILHLCKIIGEERGKNERSQREKWREKLRENERKRENWWVVGAWECTSALLRRTSFSKTICYQSLSWKLHLCHSYHCHTSKVSSLLLHAPQLWLFHQQLTVIRTIVWQIYSLNIIQYLSNITLEYCCSEYCCNVAAGIHSHANT